MHKRSAPLGPPSSIPLGCKFSVIQLLQVIRKDPEFIPWTGQYKILPGIYANIFPLIMQKISGAVRIRSEYYPYEEKVVLSLRGLESFCFDIPESVRKFLFRPEEESGFGETIIIKRAAQIKLMRNYIIPDSALYINSASLPFMVIDVVNEKSVSAVNHRLGAYIAAKGQIRFSILLSTQNVDPQQKPNKTRFMGKVHISAYEITKTKVQTLLFKTEIWPCVPKGELILDGIWEVHAHIPLKLLHDSICQVLGNGDGILTGTVRKAAGIVLKGLDFSPEEGNKEDGEDQPQWPIKNKCTEINLGRRITIWRKPSSNPPYLVVEHLS